MIRSYFLLRSWIMTRSAMIGCSLVVPLVESGITVVIKEQLVNKMGQIAEHRMIKERDRVQMQIQVAIEGDLQPDEVV